MDMDKAFDLLQKKEKETTKNYLDLLEENAKLKKGVEELKEMKGNHGLRPELATFAEAIETKLKKNDYKPSWKDESLDYLLERLIEEAGELYSTVKIGGDMADEAVDVANYAMMVYTYIEGK